LNKQNTSEPCECSNNKQKHIERALVQTGFRLNIPTDES